MISSGGPGALLSLRFFFGMFFRESPSAHWRAGVPGTPTGTVGSSSAPGAALAGGQVHGDGQNSNLCMPNPIPGRCSTLVQLGIGWKSQQLLQTDPCGCTGLSLGGNKMECGVAGHKQSRDNEIMNEIKSTLIEAGWKGFR